MLKTPLPTKTRAAVYEPGGATVLKDVDLSPLQAGELLVRVTACGICASETLRWYAEDKAPFALGHEAVGIIEACGAGAAPHQPWQKPFEPGERVFVHHHAPCMTCRRCRRGDFAQCDTWRATGLQPGGMSQYALVPAEIVRSDVLRVPDFVSDEAAVFIEPLATVMKAARRAEMRAGDRVAVIGLGVMGLLFVALARRRGAQTVIGADLVAARLERAAQLGAQHVVNSGLESLPERVAAATSGEGADVVIVTPGDAAALDDAAACVAPGGTIVIFTPLPPERRWPMPVHDLFFKDVRVVTSYSAGPNDIREALQLLVSGLDIAPIVTHSFGLDDVAEAYRLASESSDALKIIVYPTKSKNT